MLFLHTMQHQVGDFGRPPGKSDGVMADGGDYYKIRKKAGSAAVPHVTFPAEQLATARDIGIMKGYFRAGFSGSRSGGGVAGAQRLEKAARGKYEQGYGFLEASSLSFNFFNAFWMMADGLTLT